MRKKAIVKSSFLGAIIIVLVIFAAGYLIYGFLLGEESPVERFLGIAGEYKVGEKTEFDKAYDMIDNIPEADTVNECDSRYNAVENLLSEKGLAASDDDAEVHTKIARLRAQAKNYRNFCEGNARFNNAEFTGSNKDNFISDLETAEDYFEDVSEMYSDISQEAEQKREKIKKIKECDFDDEDCKPEKTKNYCVGFEHDEFIGKGFKCEPAICDKPHKNYDGEKAEKYCDAISKLGFCYPYYGIKTTKTYGERIGDFRTIYQFHLYFKSCKSCSEVEECEDYGWDVDSCEGDVCQTGMDCYRERYRKKAYGFADKEQVSKELRGCTEVKRDRPCEDYRTREFCENVGENCVFIRGLGCKDEDEEVKCSDFGPHQSTSSDCEDVGDNCVLVKPTEEGDWVCKDCSEINECEDYGYVPHMSSKSNTNCKDDVCNTGFICELKKPIVTWSKEAIYPCVSK